MDVSLSSRGPSHGAHGAKVSMREGSIKHTVTSQDLNATESLEPNVAKLDGD